MQIEFITQELHEELKNLAAAYPELVLQNDGYEYLGSEKRKKYAAQILRIENILKQHIVGFFRFHNFRYADGALVLRFDYNWGAEDNSRTFIGVGYLPLDHLRDGFPESDEPVNHPEK